MHLRFFNNSKCFDKNEDQYPKERINYMGKERCDMITDFEKASKGKYKELETCSGAAQDEEVLLAVMKRTGWGVAGANPCGRRAAITTIASRLLDVPKGLK